MQILRGENGRILAKRKKNTTRGIGYTRIEPLPGGAHVWQCSHQMRAQLTKGGRKMANTSCRRDRTAKR